MTLDDDLQNPPEEISQILARLERRTKMWSMARRLSEQHGFLRDLASRITKLALQSVMGAETARRVSTFRLFRTRLRDAFTDYQGPFVSIDVLLTWDDLGFLLRPGRARPSCRRSRRTTRSGRLVAHALNMATGFSTVPLQSRKHRRLPVHPVRVRDPRIRVVELPAQAAVPSRVSRSSHRSSQCSVALSCSRLGIIGEYLARIHFRTMGRPTYVVPKRRSNHRCRHLACLS